MYQKQYDSKAWKTFWILDFSQCDEHYQIGTVESLSAEVVKNALDDYSGNLLHSRWKLVIPEDLKVMAEKQDDTLIFVLCRPLKHFVDFIGNRAIIQAITYGNNLKIENITFALPQLIPDKHDPLAYHTRLSKALLHVFSYPGSSACRCEMDSERNISLFLFSLFDWFGVLQHGSSTQETINSLRIFKRDRCSKWTRGGLVPIVFLSQRLQPSSELKKVAQALQTGNAMWGCPIPEALVPFVAAVEPTLKLMLVHAVNEWRDKRNTTNEKKFVLPEWLFIHGIVYDALRINIYTFRPRILEFDDSGLPSKWEYACVPTEPFEYCLFDDRIVGHRVSTMSVLLILQRHTNRVCRILDELESSSCTVMSFEPIIPEESEHHGNVCTNDETINTIADGRNKADDIKATETPTELAELATQCLTECIRRSGLESRCEDSERVTSWSFFDRPSNLMSDSVFGLQKCFLAGFMNNWRTGNSEKLYLPEEWFTTIYDPKEHEYGMTISDLFKFFPRSSFQLYTSGWRENFGSLTTEELQNRHLDPHSFSPDFYLSTPARIPQMNQYDEPPLENLRPDTVHSLEHFKEVYQYVCHEFDAKMAMSSLFMCIPGCWLRYDTDSRFPSALANVDSFPVDFSLLLHPIQTVPLDMTPITPDVNLRATILNPALVVAIQGPATWPDELSCSPALLVSRPRPKDKSEALRQLAQAIEPSLKTHLINWQLRFEQGLVLSRDLPPWFMLFGVIYDAEEVNIVAHIPHMTGTDSQYSFVSCIIDTIPFPPVTGSSKITEPWLLNRFRVGLALMSLQKHAFQMAGLWECVLWPDELVSWEEIVEREYLGPALTPSQRGRMLPPHPMALLYREMRGSDETLVDHSGDVSELEEEEDDGDEEMEDGEDEDEDDSDEDEDED